MAELADKIKAWVAAKIKFLMEKEGLPQKEAQAKAIGMARTKFGNKKDEKAPAKKEPAKPKEE